MLFRRGTIIFLGISLFIGVLTVTTKYLYFSPKRDVEITFQSTGQANALSQGREFRINYVQMDGKLLPLKPYVSEGWTFDGTLVTGSDKPLVMNLSGMRTIELSIKKGGWTPIIEITVNGETTTVDTYSQQDGSQYFKKIELNPFFSIQNILAGAFSGTLCFFCLYGAMRKRKSRDSNYFDEQIRMTDICIAIGIPLFVIFLMSGCFLFSSSKNWTSWLDVSAFVGDGKLTNMGLIPYSQIFDHKGPFLFWFNALGFLYWYPYGAGILETMLHIVGFYFCYFALKEFFSKFVALAGTLCTIIMLTNLMNFGSYVEAWSLPFIFVSFYIFIRAFKNNCLASNASLILAGVFCAIVFLLRMNCIVLWIAAIPIIIAMHIKEKKYLVLIRQVLWFSLGFGVVIGLVSIYFQSNNAFQKFFEANFTFNIQYMQIRGAYIGRKISGLIELMKSAQIRYAHILIVLSLFGGFLHITNEKEIDKRTAKKRIYSLYIFYFLIFIVLNGLSGRGYAHYAIILAPAIALCMAYNVEWAVGLLGQLKLSPPYKMGIVVVALLIITSNLLSTMCMNTIRANQPMFGDDKLVINSVSNYIESNTKPNEPYGAWGHGNWLQTLIDRKPATRFFYSNDSNIMNEETPIGKKFLSEYLEVMERNKPKYFVVTTEINVPRKVVNFIEENYVVDDAVFTNYKVIVYKLK